MALSDYDALIQTLADYAASDLTPSDEALTTAHYCLLDSLACAMQAMAYPACTQHLGPIIPGTQVPGGVHVPLTEFELDPVTAAFNFGMQIRWLDFNDTWLAAEWGHPSDNLAAIYAAACYRHLHGHAVSLKELLVWMIKAHEIQGILALSNSFNRVGLDHVILVKLASCAVSSAILGGTQEQICAAISHVFADGHSLRTYRHAPNAGPRKSWAAGDASARGLHLAFMVLRGEPGIPSVLSTPTWGFNDVLFKGQALTLTQPLADYVMRHVLFKISYPAEFHAQTAVEAACQLHPEVKPKLAQISRVLITTHESAMRIINKTGPLTNPAARDHCLQYMVACALLDGELTAKHYEDDYASDPAIDSLREKMHVQESKQFSDDYLDPEKRSISNTVQVEFDDGSVTEAITIEYPLGHRRRREEGMPVLLEKFVRSSEGVLSEVQRDWLLDTLSAKDLSRISVADISARLLPQK